MLTVIKRNGKREPFDIGKIKNSLAATSDEIGQPMGSGDLNSIAKEIEELLEGKSEVTSRQIVILVSGILCADGYEGVLRAYMSSEKNKWKNGTL